MQADQAATPPDEGFQGGLLLFTLITGIAFINHYFGVFQVSAAWRMQSAIDHRAVFGQDFAPIRKKLRIVVFAGQMRFQAGPNIDVHAVWILALWPGSRRRLRSGAQDMTQEQRNDKMRTSAQTAARSSTRPHVRQTPD